MSSKWNHAMCCHCWHQEKGDRVPVRAVGREEVCCFCQTRNWDGIFVRRDPALVACGGEHGEDEEG
jgi:hypothetical protein